MTQILPSTTIQDIERGMMCIPSGFLLVDPLGEVVLANDLAVELFGYERKELIGKSVDELVPVDVR
ncbi:MAG: PAS domain S-box-containing protein, partial [Candidatus Paceibacteria bacterium]